jgi:uncharacterized RDD family membrane protein YckC
MPGPKVIPIPTLTPVNPSAGARRGMARSAAASASGAAAAPAEDRTARAGRYSSLQQSLDFDASQATRHPRMELETAKDCDAPVAMPLHRFIAASFDASMVLIGLGLFLGVFLLSGGRIVFNKQVIPMFLGAVGLIWALYHTLWCMANGDTPGMRFAGLRVLNFDGRPADRKERGLRQSALVLSALSAGVGLLWAFLDEEHLTWHDHISETFPTSQ